MSSGVILISDEMRTYPGVIHLHLDIGGFPVAYGAGATEHEAREMRLAFAKRVSAKLAEWCDEESDLIKGEAVK